MKNTFCDPPSGWKYGFPRIIPQEILHNLALERENTEPAFRTVLNNWLVSCGYPKSLIELYGNHFYCRYWEEELNE